MKREVTSFSVVRVDTLELLAWVRSNYPGVGLGDFLSATIENHELVMRFRQP